jgi:hypothetical protein
VVHWMVRIVGQGSPTIVSISKPSACTSTETFPNDCREGREGRGVDGGQGMRAVEMR